MAKIVWTEEAVRWMKEIRDYIAVENPNAAQRVVTGIYDRSKYLGNFQKLDTSTDERTTA